MSARTCCLFCSTYCFSSAGLPCATYHASVLATLILALSTAGVCQPTPSQVDHLMKPENLALLEKARVVYCTGFFITVSPDSIRTVAKHCADNDKIYAMVRA